MTRTAAAVLALALAWPLAAQERSELLIRQVHASARPSLVGLEIQLRKKTRLERREDAAPDAEREEEDGSLAQLAENRLTLDAWAVVLDGAGLLAMANPGFKPSDVESIKGTSPDGTPFEARLEAVGRGYDALFLTADPPPGGAMPASFEEFAPFELGDYYYVAALERVDRRWHVNITPYIVTNAPLVPEKGWFLIDRVRPGGLVFDRKGRCVGVPFDDFLWVDAEGRDSFVGKDFLADPRLSLKSLEELQAKAEASVAAAVRRVEMDLREGEERDRYGREEKSPRVVLFAVPVDDQGTLFVPMNLPANLIRKVEEITAGPAVGPRAPAAFLGRFKDFGGMLLRIEGSSTCAADASVKALERGLLYFTVQAEEKFGGTHVSARPNRVFRVEKGPKGAYKDDFRRSTRLGAFVCDLDGRIVGFYTHLKKEEDLEEAHAREEMEAWVYRRGGNGRPAFQRRIFLFDEALPILQKPEDRLDPRAMPVSKTLEKRLVWLGVEFHELTKPLAQIWGLEDKDLTNDGKRGLLVTEVYPGSPAERIGLQVQDILLTVTAPNGKTIDLTPEPDRYGRFGRGGPTPWRARKNYLTAMLTQIGAGQEVALEVLRGKEKHTARVKLEDEPLSFESAEKHKDEAMGLTVKAITYEVRYYHRLGPAEGAVVAAKVENGSKADVAKIQTLSLITRINDMPFQDLAEFQERIKALRASGAKTVTFTVCTTGQTRLADVDLGP